MSLEWEKARVRAHDAPEPLTPGRLAAADALDTTLAEPLVAAAAVPAFTSSAMDGYAVAGPGPWRLVGAAAAGDPVRSALTPGTALAVATGAPLPAGVEAVLRSEHAEVRGDHVAGSVDRGRDIRHAGEVFEAGTVLAPAGTPVTPVLLGLAAGAAVDELSVHGPVTVDCVLTGSELMDSGRPERGRVRDAVGPMLPGLVPGLGARLGAVHRIGDGADQLASLLSGSTARVVLTCGATSLGPTDVLRSVLAAAGAELIVDGVDCRPGHPQLLARLPQGRWVVGLPGNPQAALVAALTLLGPLVLGLLGRPLPPLPVGRLVADGYAHQRRTRLIPVGPGECGGLIPVGNDGPASLWGAALAGTLAVVPARWDGREPVALVPIPGSVPAR